MLEVEVHPKFTLHQHFIAILLVVLLCWNWFISLCCFCGLWISTVLLYLASCMEALSISINRRFYHDEDQLAFGMCLVLFTFLFIYFVFQDLEIAADFNVTVTMMELFDKLEQTNHVRVSASPPFHLGSCWLFLCLLSTWTWMSLMADVIRSVCCS